MNEYEYQVGYDLVGFDDFVSFLTAVEQDFVPPLLRRIDINEYYTKCRKNATFAVCRRNDEIIGLAVFYCNDTVKKKAYVTLFAVKREYRGHGIAKILLGNIADFSRQLGMEVVGLHTNNELAYKVYLKSGFELQETIELPDLNLKRYYLEKKYEYFIDIGR